ncbi:hypothetical protein [Candidatus Nitrotoga sp. M5]|uniref:hypothetical protein n=1 Tax=Candidatus Nitrotoga sp. M5 TaxID=2890409 RepID=UPI001EF43D58|nr:hypothetical protein [Candidatus Nitrotoga sp. M5]
MKIQSLPRVVKWREERSRAANPALLIQIRFGNLGPEYRTPMVGVRFSIAALF